MLILGFLCGSAGEESTCNAGDRGLIPGLGRSLGEGEGYPLQYSGLEKSKDCLVHGATKSRTQLSDFHFHFMLIPGVVAQESLFFNLQEFCGLVVKQVVIKN